MRSRKGALLIASLIGLLLGCAATVGAATIYQGGGPLLERPSTAESAAPVVVPVTKQTIVDNETISGTLSWASVHGVVVNSGIVTAMPVPDGTSLTSGQVFLEVNDSPVVALGMRFGLWRDLSQGDTGGDVRELHAALAMLGLFDPDVGSPVGSATFSALEEIDPRFAGPTISASSIAAIGVSGASLAAPGVEVGTILGDVSVGISRASHRIAVADGGRAAEYVRVGDAISLHGDGSSAPWTGTVTSVEPESSRTLLTVAGDGDLPEVLVAAVVSGASTDGEVLAVPRVALRPRPDGRSVLVVESAGSSVTEVAVETGLCTTDLCEVVPVTAEDAEILVEGAQVRTS